jgi:UDP-N-acetylglucosamine--N-acetylmuramyl-(pentapeptide) pyrophosphoryl-undecaprenol N-acetylglucosamine transferase
LILILAGGGGHTATARILAEELRDKAEIGLLAPRDDPLTSFLEEFGPVEMMTRPRHPTTPMWRFIPRLLKAFYEAFGRLPEDVNVAVSTGGNFCVPPALIAWMRGVPLVNIESRVRLIGPSRTAALLQHFATLTALQWEEQTRFLRGVVFGPLMPRRRLKPWDGGYILVSGGTYGFRELFEAVSASGLGEVVLQTGCIDPSPYRERHPNWRVIDYTRRFEELIAGARVIVSPPGAIPLEVAAYGKPLVVVGYPRWTKAAKPRDVELFAEKLNAPLLREPTPEDLIEAIEEAEKRERPRLRSGSETLARAILELAIKN